MSCSIRVASALLSLSLVVPAVANGREPTFEDRVRAEEALARVYHSHQIGTARPFEEAVPRVSLEKRVTTYLRQTAALETIWKTPVTTEMLRREMKRMSVRSRMPERLRELHAALGNDLFLIQECLAREILVDRLARNLFAFDERIHAEALQEAEELQRGLTRLGVESFATDPRRTEIEVAGAGAAGRGIALSPEAFARWRMRAPERVGEIGPVRSERDAFVISVVLEEGPVSARIANFSVPKRGWDDWWTESAGRLDDSAASRLPEAAVGNEALDDPFSQRSNDTAVWTGSLMIVWGGYDGVLLNTGGRYDPATDNWTMMSTTNAPSAREHHEAVWTGTAMVVSGGRRGAQLDAGGQYDPATDAWTATSLAAGGETDDGFGTASAGTGSGRTDLTRSVSWNVPRVDIAFPGENIVFDDPVGVFGGRGLIWPLTSPVASQWFMGANAVDFNGNRDNVLCWAYNSDCLGSRVNGLEHATKIQLEASYDRSALPGRQDLIEWNWDVTGANGAQWRPMGAAIDMTKNSGAGAASWRFSPDNQNGMHNASLILAWPYAAFNVDDSEDSRADKALSAWARSADFTPGTVSAFHSTFYLNHGDDRSAYYQRGLAADIDFNSTSTTAKVGHTFSAFLTNGFTGSADGRTVSQANGIRQEVNLTQTGSGASVGNSLGFTWVFNPSGTGITLSGMAAGLYVPKPAAPGGSGGTQTTIGNLAPIWIEDLGLDRAGYLNGSAIRIDSQSTSNGNEGNIWLRGGGYKTGHIWFGTGSTHLFEETGGRLRLVGGRAPVSAADGNAVVTGTASDSHGVILWGVSTAIDPLFDAGTKVCAGSGMTCVDAMEIGSTTSVGCAASHVTPKWMAFCK
jgi:hypothetical protein